METPAIRGSLLNHPENYPALYHVSRFWMDLLEAVRRRFIFRRFFFERELALDDKVARVMRLLERGDARIVFDPPTGSVDIVTARGTLVGEKH